MGHQSQDPGAVGLDRGHRRDVRALRRSPPAHPLVQSRLDSILVGRTKGERRRGQHPYIYAARVPHPAAPGRRQPLRPRRARVGTPVAGVRGGAVVQPQPHTFDDRHRLGRNRRPARRRRVELLAPRKSFLLSSCAMSAGFRSLLATAAALLCAALFPIRGVTQTPKYPQLPSETPADLKPAVDGFDYVRREVMIPMRDGVRLHTVVLMPKGAANAPILLTRTPYNADDLTGHAHSSHLGPILSGYDNAADVIVQGGYIRVVQDVRGKYKSEGDYVMNRPLHGPLNPTPVDHATDTYDTIDWLVKNVPESNGRVGI